MFLAKWVSILAFIVMVCAGIYHFAGDVSGASKLCYVAAGVFGCGLFYVTTLHKIFPKTGMADRVADILERTVEARQITLMHHIQHEHQADLAAIKRMNEVQLPQHTEVQPWVVPGGWRQVIDSEEVNVCGKIPQTKG